MQIIRGARKATKTTATGNTIHSLIARINKDGLEVKLLTPSIRVILAIVVPLVVYGLASRIIDRIDWNAIILRLFP
jgi:hypothetical protein